MQARRASPALAASPRGAGSAVGGRGEARVGDVRRAVAQAMRYAGCLNRRSLGVSDVYPPGGRRSSFACPNHDPSTARKMALVAGDLGLKGVSTTGGCCSTPPTAVGKARGARIRTGRLYSFTRTIDDKPRNSGSAKDRCREGEGKAVGAIGRL